MLVVAPLSGHHATLLRDTVKTLLRDHKVYITDWIDARMVPAGEGPFHLDDYVAYIEEFIRPIGAENLHVISVCQPTVPVLAAVSLMAARGEDDAAFAGDDGRADRHAREPDQGQRPGHAASRCGGSRANLDPRRAAELSRPRPPRVSGLPAARRLRGDEPRTPFPVALGFLPGPGQGRPRGRRSRTAASTTNTTPCSTCPPSTTWRPCDVVFQRAPAAARPVGRARRARRSRARSTAPR